MTWCVLVNRHYCLVYCAKWWVLTLIMSHITLYVGEAKVADRLFFADLSSILSFRIFRSLQITLRHDFDEV